MRMLVFFDLPTTTRSRKRAYVLFRRFLLEDGYDMLQWSVYGRIINGGDAWEKHLKRLKANLPPEGAVRCMQVTEKQFAGMEILVGTRKSVEKRVNECQLLLF